MSRSLLILLVAFAITWSSLAGNANAEDFSVRGVGLAFSLPAGWRYKDRVGGQSDMRRFVGPEGMIIVHPTRPEAKTPEDALHLSVAYFTELNPYWRQKDPPLEIVLLDSKPFVTAAGLHGLQGFFGSPGAKQPSTVMHYIPTASGHIACICVERCRSSADRTQLEKAIIESVRQVRPSLTTRTIEQRLAFPSFLYSTLDLASRRCCAWIH